MANKDKMVKHIHPNFICIVIFMKNPAVFGFYGESNTGKTSLIVKVIKRLTNEKFKVVTVKITDKNIGIDTEGKDTWKHNQAGSKIVVLSSPVETGFIIKRNKDIEAILQHIGELTDCDVVLIEGANDPSTPKIRLGKNIQERENTIISYDGKLDTIIELIKGEIEKRKDDETGKVIVRINGKQIPLTEFPSEFIKRTIIGMMSPLKGVDKINKVEIYFKQ